MGILPIHLPRLDRHFVFTNGTFAPVLASQPSAPWLHRDNWSRRDAIKASLRVPWSGAHTRVCVRVCVCRERVRPRGVLRGAVLLLCGVFVFHGHLSTCALRAADGHRVVQRVRGGHAAGRARAG